MATEECAICGDSVPFATTTHVLVNPKHEDGVADHYVCRPCYDEHLAGLFVALESENEQAPDLAVDAVGSPSEDGAEVSTEAGDDVDPEDGAEGDGPADDGRPPVDSSASE